MTFARYLAPLVLVLTAGCGDVDDHHDHNHGEDHGVLTTVVLNFTPANGGDTLSFRWSDPSDSANPSIDDILLPDASDHGHHDSQVYDLTVEFWNELEDPAEAVTPEILELAEQHQVFLTGDAVDGPATGGNTDALIEHSYGDSDADGLPLGLSNTITTAAWGTGEITVTLRHMPAEDGQPVKVAGVAQTVADDGFGAIGGGNDIQVSFPITVE